MATVKRVPQGVQPPPDRIHLDLSIEEAAYVCGVLSHGNQWKALGTSLEDTVFFALSAALSRTGSGYSTPQQREYARGAALVISNPTPGY